MNEHRPLTITDGQATLHPDHIRQAADVIHGMHPAGDCCYCNDHRALSEGIAAALDAAGLLVTPEELRMREILADNPRPDVEVDALFERIKLEQAVLDAVLREPPNRLPLTVVAAVDAYRAAAPKDDQ